MITIENTEVYGWKAAIRGMRNPMNSWDKSDTEYTYTEYIPSDRIDEDDVDDDGYFETYPLDCPEIGDNDLKLMKNLIAAGSDHRKFMRFITVTCDITAPIYWVSEHDTYKISTTRNSCSFMHKGLSKPFEISDFSIQDNQILDILSPIPEKSYPAVFPYETDEYRIYTTDNGRKYKVFKNGRVARCEFSFTDSFGTGRTRIFQEKECTPSVNRSGYYELQIGGRSGEKWLLHRLVAYIWVDNPNECDTVNHIDGNKGNNCVENLEWCSLEENISKGFNTGLYSDNKLHSGYIKWKNGHRVVSPMVKHGMKIKLSRGASSKDLSSEYNIPLHTINNLLYTNPCENSDIFYQAFIWENVIQCLNNLRELYIETQDVSIFKEIRQLLPQGYNVRYTWQANYEVLRNIYHARKAHKLDEWVDFCKWIESLPYSELITE